MLVGSTFAWFTDSVTSGNNKIVAGNLSIDLVHVGSGEDGEDVSIKENSDHLIFDYDKWEPGYTALEALKVENKGNLALKYKLNVLIQGAGEAENAAGEKTTLADVIDVYVYYGSDSDSYKKPASFADITAEGSKWQKAGTLAAFMADPNKTMISGVLLPVGKEPKKDDEAVVSTQLTVALHMQELAGNEYQSLSLGDLSLILSATQYTYEDDSFNDQYDVDAKLPDVVVSSSDDLLNAMRDADGDIIALTGGTYSLGSKMVTYTDKEFTLIAMDDEKVTINGEFAFNGSSKVTIQNIDIYAENGPMLIEGNAEFNMNGGSLASGGYYAALLTNGGKTRGAKVTLDGVHLIAKRSNGTDGYAIYAPGQADYTLKNCVVDGCAIFCAGNVVMEGGSITYNKSFAINGNAYNTNTATYDGKQYFDSEEALAGLKRTTNGALGLGDALQFDGNRGSGYEKLERVEIRNTKITATSTQDNEQVFGIRYVESCVEGDTHETVFVLENIDTSIYNIPTSSAQ